MNQDQHGTGHGSRARTAFGQRAADYANSQVHVSDDSLEIIRGLVGIASSPSQWAVDLGTGAGFNAFNMAQLDYRTVATDPAGLMLREARRIGGERGLCNLTLCQSSAESLPFASSSLDIVGSRMAAYHFGDYQAVISEAHRVLKVGGALLIADSVAPEDSSVSDWMEDVELRRDFSHVENRKASVIEALVTERGLDMVDRVHTSNHLRFNGWVARTAIPESDAESLRRVFLNAPTAVKDAFEIQEVGDDIHFAWPCLVFRALKN